LRRGKAKKKSAKNNGWTTGDKDFIIKISAVSIMVGLKPILAFLAFSLQRLYSTRQYFLKYVFSQSLLK